LALICAAEQALLCSRASKLEILELLPLKLSTKQYQLLDSASIPSELLKVK
jgi:hypothetical protein